MLNVKKLVSDYHRSANSFGELLPWACSWDERNVVTLDQGLLAVFTYTGIDAEGSTDATVDASTHTLEKAFSGFTTGNTVWSYVDRRKTTSYPKGVFTNEVSTHINESWREQITHEQYENTYSMAIHQRASEGAMAFFDAVDVILKEENVGLPRAMWKAGKAQLSMGHRMTLDERRMKAALQKLEARTAELRQSMSSLGLRQLEGDELLGYLHQRANPASGGRAGVRMPRIPAFLQNLLANDSLERLPKALKFSNNGDVYVGVVSLKGWPDDATFPGRLDALTNIQGEVTVAHCFRFLDRAVAEKAISDIQQYNIAKSVPFFHRILTSLSNSEPTKFNAGRVGLAEDASDALRELYESGRVFGYHNLTVLCYGNSMEEMESVREQVHSALRDSGFTGFTEGMHQVTAFTQTLPGQWGASVRWSNVSFGNAADLMPVRTLWAGSPTAKFFSAELGRGPQPTLVSLPTDSGVPFFWDPFETGLGHATIIGPAGMGKSVQVNFLLSQFRKYAPCRTVIFDKDFTCQVPTLVQDGEHYDLTPEDTGATRMAPMALVSDPKNHPFLVRWVQTLINLARPGVPISPDELEMITNGVRAMKDLPREMHRLSYLSSSLGANLAPYLSQWVEGGINAMWFDNPPQDLELGDHVCFECKRLFDNKDVAALAMMFLFHVVEQRLDGVPTIIYVEEAWFFVQNPEFASQLEDYVRTLRKRNAALWLTSQGLKEFAATEILETMLQSIPNRIFLPNPDIQSHAALYERVMGLNDAQLRRIQYATPKRDYYIVTPNAARMASARLPEDIVALCGSSTKIRKTFARHYAQRHTNKQWREDYLKEMLNA